MNDQEYHRHWTRRLIFTSGVHWTAEVNQAYTAAREAGELAEPVPYKTLADYLEKHSAEIDTNNVPSGLPRSYRLPYSLKLAERSLKARDEIMAGNPQEGTSEELNGDETATADARAQRQDQQDGGITSTSTGQVNLDDILAQIPRVEFRPMTGPVLPPKP